MARKNPHAVALGRRGGKVVTEKKLAALRLNALKGGRKPKFTPGDRVVGRDSAAASFRGRAGTIEGPTHNRAEYWVRFDDGAREACYSWWLDKVVQH